jgi:hypothetical protein
MALGHSNKQLAELMGQRKHTTGQVQIANMAARLV